MKFIFILFLPILLFGKDYTAKDIVYKASKYFSYYDNSKIKINLVSVDKKTKDVKQEVIVVKTRVKNKNRLFKFEFEKKDRNYLYNTKFKKYNDNFLDTDFLYYDFNLDIKKGILNKLEDEVIENIDCYTIELLFKDIAPYLKLEMNIRKRDFFPLKIKFYDKNNNYFKKITVKNVKKIDNKLTFKKVYVIDRKIEHATIVNLEDVDFDFIFNDVDFRDK